MKKSCENCLRKDDKNSLSVIISGFCQYWMSPFREFDICEKWQRNPSLWLSILPTEPGWYFERKTGIKDRIIEVVKDAHGNICEILHDGWKGKLQGNQWQGPITPHRGRDEIRKTY